MRQTHQNPDESKLRHEVLLEPRAGNTTDSEALSDLQAVIAVMSSGGLTCEEIALVLPLPLRMIEDALQHAVGILGLSGTEDLTHLVVAAHYDRTALTPRAHPKHQAENAPPLTDDTSNSDAPTLCGLAQASRGMEPDVLPPAYPTVHSSSHADCSVNSLVLLDAAEAAQVHAQELADPAPMSGSLGKGQPR
ncbi:hypothetical protein RCH21_003352 [Arthrobacter sp. PL16]|nr:hypothetical protein [Arthrobacter sp. PL16]